MNNQSYLWETSSLRLDPAFTLFYENNRFLVDGVLIIGFLILIFGFLSIWFAPHITYNLFVVSSFVMSVGFMMAFVSKAPSIMFMILMLYSMYKAVRENKDYNEGYCHAE